MHPLSFSSRSHYSRAPQIREMPRNLWLRLAQNLHKVTDADFLIAHEIEEPKACGVSECLEEPLHIEGLLLGIHS